MKKLDDALVQSVLSEEEFREYAAINRRLAENSRAIPTEPSMATHLEGVMVSLAEGIAPRLHRARADAAKDRREKEAAELPWVSALPTRQMAADLTRMIWFNNRIRTSLAQLATKHAIAARGLELQQVVVDDVLARQHGDLGKEMTRFALRLQKAGLKTASFKDLSNSAVTALVKALNCESDVNLLAILGVASNARDAVEDSDGHDDEVAALERQAAAIEEEIASLDTVSSEPLSPLLPPSGLPPLEEWDYATGPLPRECWSGVQEMAIPYRWEYRLARPDEETVLEMELPEAHSWAALRALDSRFAELSREYMRTARGGTNFVKDIFELKYGVKPDQLHENTIKTWLLLLVGRFMSQEECEELFKPGYFDGLVMPCPAMGGRVVRELVREA